MSKKLLKPLGGLNNTKEKSNLMIKLGEAIKSHRIQKSLSQEDLAKQLGFHRTYLGALERGERRITLVRIVHICRNLGVEPAELLSFLW